MKPAIVGNTCRLMGMGENCRTCREKPEWRAFMGTPAECPAGITADSLPAPGFRVKLHRLNPDGSRCAPCGAKTVTFRAQK